jgi:hypothetical protein
MADHVNLSQANGWFKTSYGDLKDLIPENLYYAKEIPALDSSKQPGADYSVGVTLTSEQGVTKASSQAGAFALNPPIALASSKTSIAGSQILLRSALDYESVFASKNQNAFVQATKGVIKNMLKSVYGFIEADIMWGKTGLGVLSAAAGTTLTITTATYAAGLWRGSENRKLRIESAAGVLRGTCTITGYSISGRTLTVDAIPAGTIATDVLFLEADGASGANCMQGLYGAMAVQTGTLWGINRSTYGLWRPAGLYSAGSAPLSFNKIMGAIAQAEDNGLGDQAVEVDCVVSTKAWKDLGNDMAALRSLDSSYKSGEAQNGAEKLTFFSPVGKVSIFAHKMMKEGYAFIHPKASKAFEMVGAQPKPTFALPGMNKAGEEYLRPMENNAGFETRLYFNGAVFSTMINETIVINNIVNAA